MWGIIPCKRSSVVNKKTSTHSPNPSSLIKRRRPSLNRGTSPMIFFFMKRTSLLDTIITDHQGVSSVDISSLYVSALRTLLGQNRRVSRRGSITYCGITDHIEKGILFLLVISVIFFLSS